MGVHVTCNVLKMTRAETINTLSGCLIKSFIVKVTCSIVDAQVRLVFPSQSRCESIRACCTRFLLVRWVVLLHLYSSYFPFIKQQDLIWVLEYQRWFLTSSHLVGNLCVALGLSIMVRLYLSCSGIQNFRISASKRIRGRSSPLLLQISNEPLNWLSLIEATSIRDLNLLQFTAKQRWQRTFLIDSINIV